MMPNRRWRAMPHRDAVYDTERIYPSIDALELFRWPRPKVNRKDLWTKYGWPTDDLLTAYARRRPVRFHPWKRARTTR